MMEFAREGDEVIVWSIVFSVCGETSKVRRGRVFGVLHSDRGVFVRLFFENYKISDFQYVKRRLR